MVRAAKNIKIIALCVLAMTLAGCGKKDAGQQPKSTQQAPAQTGGQAAGQAAPAPQAPAGGQATAGAQAPATEQAPSPTDMAKLAEQNRQALTKMNQGKVVQAVSGDTLKALLPADLPGMKRTDASSERTQMMGVDMSKAKGQYSPENGEGNINITMTDVGNMSGPMRMGMAGWAMAQYNRETDSGYEKTMTYKGYKGMEQYNKNNKDGTVRVIVADRFIVEVEGNGVTMDTLKQALDKIDLGKLSTSGS